jgi:hypothetical protein
MLEAYLHALASEDVGLEDLTTTRERLKERFPRAATRRMTQLGLLVGSLLDQLHPAENDTVVYASGYAESRALESYLESFPTASPTLFQTSIHPSAVQQLLIARQQPIRQLFPMTGGANLVPNALQVALLAPSPRTLVCGGEERGTWLLEHGIASERTFAFAFSLQRESAGALAYLSLDFVESQSSASDAGNTLSLHDFYTALHERRTLALSLTTGVRLTLSWL